MQICLVIYINHANDWPNNDTPRRKKTIPSSKLTSELPAKLVWLLVTFIILPYLYCEYDLDFTILPSFVLTARKLTSEYDSSPFNWLKWPWKPGTISIQIKSRHSYAIKGEEERSCKLCAISHGRPRASVLWVGLSSDRLTDPSLIQR